MPALRFESPLKWPKSLPATPRTGQRNDHGITAQVSLTESIQYLDQELADMKAAGTLSLDIEQPAVERLRKKIGGRTGASLEFRYREKPYVIACDRWATVEHNVYMLHLALRQWRNIERWGVASLEALLQGVAVGSGLKFSGDTAELPAWMQALGLGPTATLDDAVAVYHRRAKSVSHDDDALTKLNLVMDEAREHFGSGDA